MYFNAIRENKTLAEISEYKVPENATITDGKQTTQGGIDYEHRQPQHN